MRNFTGSLGRKRERDEMSIQVDLSLTQRPPRSRIPELNSESFVSVTWCCVTNDSKTWRLKTKAILFLGILWLNSAGGQRGPDLEGLLDLFLQEVFHPQGGQTELPYLHSQGSIPQGRPPRHEHVSHLCSPPLPWLSGQNKSCGLAQRPCQRGSHQGRQTGAVSP